MARKARASDRQSSGEARRQFPPAEVNGSEGLTIAAERRAWFTPETLAAYLQVSDRQVRNWVNDGLLISYKFGASRRFDPADVDAFVAQFRDERNPKK